MTDLIKSAAADRRMLALLARQPVRRTVIDFEYDVALAKRIFTVGLLELDVEKLREWHHLILGAVDAAAPGDLPPDDAEPDRQLALAVVLSARSGAWRR